MSWHPEPALGIHTRHPAPDIRRPFPIGQAFQLTPAQIRAMSVTHEAGHAMVFLTAGVRFDHLAFGEASGADHCIQGLPGIHLTAADHVRCCATGERASDRWLRDHGLWTPARAWANEALSASDRRQLDGYLPGDDLTVLHDRADEFLDRVWLAVLRLADALDRHGRLSYTQAAAAAGYAPLGH